VPIHRCYAVKVVLVAGGPKRLYLERLPAYAPDLNPDEGVWKGFKRGALKNRCCHGRDEQLWELGLAIRRIPCVCHAGVML
jgi:transposase